MHTRHNLKHLHRAIVNQPFRSFFSVGTQLSAAQRLSQSSRQKLRLIGTQTRSFARGSSSGNDKDFYKTLGVDKNADASDIKKSYFKLAKQYHPDVNKSAEAKEKFAKINNAYETLSDEGKRRVYD